MLVGTSMSNELYEIAYISQAVGNGHAMVKNILDTSRKNNSMRNITGSLFFDGMNFTQFLEGSLSDILPLFEIIKNDSRHINVILLHKVPIKERRFGSWSMQYGHHAA